MLLSAMTQGNIVINHICSEHLASVCAKLKEMGITTEFCEDSARVYCTDKILPAHIKTMPHPGFPTDMQSIFASLMCYASGTSVITETVFENRFMHLSELLRMNANIRIDGRTAIIEGSASLTGANVTATDLRSGAGLVLAAMGAKGTTTISNAHYIERGYEDICGQLKLLGASIERID